MKQEIKKLVFLFLLMCLFTSSQEKKCASNEKCMTVPVVPIIMENNMNDNNAAYADSDLMLMPISHFILLQ